MQAFLDGKGSLFAVLCAAFTCIAACGQTGVRPVSRTGDVNLARPARILVYNFAVSEAEVTEAHGMLRQQPTIKDPVERGREIGRQVAEVLAVELVEGLRGLGFKVERAGAEIEFGCKQPIRHRDIFVRERVADVARPDIRVKQVKAQVEAAVGCRATIRKAALVGETCANRSG